MLSFISYFSISFSAFSPFLVQPFSQRSLNPKNFSLHFNPVKLIDSGEYICTINDKSVDPVDLLVQDVPEPPSRPMITGFTSRSVNLSWAQVQDPKNAPVTEFILETRYVLHHYFYASPNNTSGVTAEKVLLQFIIHQHKYYNRARFATLNMRKKVQ